MKYYMSKRVHSHFDVTVQRVLEELKKEGFGVLSEIDVSQTLKNKINVEIPRYKILGACHPQSAYQALQAEEKIGLLLPCNVIVQDKGENETEVSAIDPIVSMKSVENPSLEKLASEVKGRLQRVIEAL